jgi:hypothetical protein
MSKIGAFEASYPRGGMTSSDLLLIASSVHIVAAKTAPSGSAQLGQNAPGAYILQSAVCTAERQNVAATRSREARSQMEMRRKLSAIWGSPRQGRAVEFGAGGRAVGEHRAS